MKQLLVLLLAATFALVSKVNADDPDPGGWTERCLDKSEGQPDWLSKEKECLAAILVYCEFARDDNECFLNLETKYRELSANLISNLPETFDGKSSQVDFYTSRFASLRELSVSQECNGYEIKAQCAAHLEIQKYLAASSLAKWLAELESEKQ